MHKKASFREPARQSGCVLVLPIAAGRRVGCRKRHSLESAPTQPVSLHLRREASDACTDEPRRPAARRCLWPLTGSAAPSTHIRRLRASHRQLRTQRAEFGRCFPLRHEALGSLSKSGRRRPMKLQTRRKHAAESPLGSTNAIGCLEQLHAPSPGVGNSPRRRTARPCESSLGTSSRAARRRLHTEPRERAKQELLGLCPATSAATAVQPDPSTAFAPRPRRSSPRNPVLACAASILVAQKSRPCTRGGRNAQESKPL